MVLGKLLWDTVVGKALSLGRPDDIFEYYRVEQPVLPAHGRAPEDSYLIFSANFRFAKHSLTSLFAFSFDSSRQLLIKKLSKKSPSRQSKSLSFPLFIFL
jgi:hypothetical protein